jgi:putative ABC transport system ATP-binding protein
MRLLRAHCDRGGTAILVTHDAAHAAWADRVVFLRDGRVVDEARPAPSHEFAGGRATDGGALAVASPGLDAA